MKNETVHRIGLALTCWLLPIVSVAQADDPASTKQAGMPTTDTVAVSAAKVDENGFHVHQARSPFQTGATTIRVLLPDSLPKNQQLAVLYVLPVEATTGTRYGDGLLEIKRQDLHNKYRVICVAPTFSDLPWYADHPTNLLLRQEMYFTDVVIPFVEKTYPALPARQGRLLLGFSKSGWGAWSLLLRHPDRFQRAAAWDAPLMMQQFGKFGNAPIFATQENFEEYRLTDQLRTKAAVLGNEPRLILTAYGNFREHHQQMHEVLRELKIPSIYRDGPHRNHDWHSGWVAEAVELLTNVVDE